MNNKCLAGIHLKTGVVEVVASLDCDFLKDHMAEIEKEGCYAVIADRDLAKDAWGKKIDHPMDLVVRRMAEAGE